MKTAFTLVSTRERVICSIMAIFSFIGFVLSLYGSGVHVSMIDSKEKNAEYFPLQDKLPSNALGKQLWSADHRDGTQNEWYLNGGGGEFNSGTGDSYVSSDVARSGNYSLKMSINTTSGTSHGTRNYRWNEIAKNEDIIFTQYFYFPNRIDFDRNNDWFNLIQTKGVKFAPGGAGTGPDQINLPHFVLGIEVRGGAGSGGANYLSLADLQKFWGSDPNVTWRAPQGVDLPVKKWVKIQMRVIQDRGDKGRIMVWQDDVLIIDTGLRNTLRPEVDINMYSINAYADKTYPNVTSIYLDDVSINLPAEQEETPVTVNPPEVRIVSPENNLAVTEGTEIVVRAEAKADGENKIAKLDFYKEDVIIGSSDRAPYSYTWRNPGIGTHKLKAVARDDKGLIGHSKEVVLIVEAEKPPLTKTPEEVAPITDVPENQFIINLNLGSETAVKMNEQTFLGESDQDYFKNTTYTYTEVNASNEALFQTERNAPELSIEIPVENGVYSVKTYHNELWFGKKGPSAIKGRRVFDIRIEGNKVKERFDMFTESNNEPVELTFHNIEVNDGKLNIDMRAWSNRATISGLSITPQQLTGDKFGNVGESFELFVNTGTRNRTSYDDIQFEGEIGGTEYFNSSSTHTYTKASDQPIFQSERHAPNLSYAIPVPNGTYLVKTYHNELWFGHQGPSAQRGRRVFSIAIEGQNVKRNFDLFVESKNQPVVLVFDDIVVNDGVLNLDMVATANRATLSGLAVIQKSDEEGSNLRVGQGEDEDVGPDEEESSLGQLGAQVLLYPNPATDKVYLDVKHGDNYQYFLIHDSQGNLVNHFYPEYLQQEANGYLLPLTGFKKGVYLVSLVTKDQGIERIRLLVSP